MESVHLHKVTRAGQRLYVWRDENGREWIVSRSRRMWYFRREDHTIGSTGYWTLEDARSALERAFEEAR